MAASDLGNFLQAVQVTALIMNTNNGEIPLMEDLDETTFVTVLELARLAELSPETISQLFDEVAGLWEDLAWLIEDFEIE